MSKPAPGTERIASFSPASRPIPAGGLRPALTLAASATESHLPGAGNKEDQQSKIRLTDVSTVLGGLPPQAWQQTVGVATDWRRPMRRLLATGDSAGVLAALASADEVGSQLAGDALLLALTAGAAGAPVIAEHCSAALLSSAAKVHRCR
jgi:hypothetical protein